MRGLYHYAIAMSEAERQVRLGTAQYEEVSSPSFDFNLSMMPERVCLELFRFNQTNLPRIVPLIAWPVAKRRTSLNRYATPPRFAACIVLARLSKPVRCCDMESLLEKFSPKLADIFQEALNHFVTPQCDLLHSDLPPVFFESRSERYSQHVYAKCMALDNAPGFIDGKDLSIAWSTEEDSNQITVYSGFKRKHALKFQDITTPYGLLAHMYGPEVGRHHDMFLSAESGVERFLSAVLQLGDEQYVVYGNSGYTRLEFLEVPYEGGNLAP